LQSAGRYEEHRKILVAMEELLLACQQERSTVKPTGEQEENFVATSETLPRLDYRRAGLKDICTNFMKIKIGEFNHQGQQHFHTSQRLTLFISHFGRTRHFDLEMITKGTMIDPVHWHCRAQGQCNHIHHWRWRNIYQLRCP